MAAAQATTPSTADVLARVGATLVVLFMWAAALTGAGAHYVVQHASAELQCRQGERLVEDGYIEGISCVAGGVTSGVRHDDRPWYVPWTSLVTSGLAVVSATGIAGMVLSRVWATRFLTMSAALIGGGCATWIITVGSI